MIAQIRADNMAGTATPIQKALLAPLLKAVASMGSDAMKITNAALTATDTQVGFHRVEANDNATSAVTNNTQRTEN